MKRWTYQGPAMYFCREHVALSYMNHLCLPAFFFSSKKTSINKPFLFCLSTAINIIIFKQSNQHHHFSSTAINIIIFQAKQSTSSFSSKAINIIIFQAKQSTSSLFKQSKQCHHFSSNIIIFWSI